MQYIRQFQDVSEFEDFVNGGIRSGGTAMSSSADKILGLHGKTLIFTTPAVTVTFADAAGTGLSMVDIAAQIAAAATVKPKLRGQRVVAIWNSTDGQPCVLGSTGTANNLFGFSTTVATTGKIYNAPSGAKPRWNTFEIAHGFDRYMLLVEE